MKNAEIIAELLADEITKFEKAVGKLENQTKDFSFEITRAKNINVNTEHLEHVITSWNVIFENQRQQILKLQKYKSGNVLFYQIAICGLTAAVFFLIISLYK